MDNTPPALTEEVALNISSELCEEVVRDEQLLEKIMAILQQ